MIKARLQGLPEEVKKLVADLKKHYRVLQESDPYPNRNSEYIRFYVEIETPGEE